MKKIQMTRRWTTAVFLSLPLLGLFMVAPVRAAAPAADVDAVVARTAAAFMVDPHAVGERDKQLKLDDDIRKYLDGDYPNLA
jgi:hypothetical protein